MPIVATVWKILTQEPPVKLTKGEEIFQHAKEELKEFLDELSDETTVLNLSELQAYINDTRKHSRRLGLTMREQTALCYHQLAVNGAIKRGY